MRALRLALVALTACSAPVDLVFKRKLPGPSVSTPLVTAELIAVGHETGVTLFDLDGRERCTFSTHREVISAPKTDGTLVFFGSTNYIAYAIDRQCQEVWKFPTADRIKSDPLVAGGVVYVSSYDGHLYALQAASGQRLWSFPSTTDPLGETPALDVAAKGKRRRAPTAAALSEVGDFSYSSPALDDGVLYVGNLDHHLYAIDAHSGAMWWRFKTDGPVTSSPQVQDGVIYFGSNDGNLYALDGATREVIWKVLTRDWVNSSPRLADGVIYVGSNDRHVYAISADLGHLKWKAEIKGPAIAIPAVYQNLVFAAGSSGDGAIYALERDDGAVFWRYTTDGKIDSDPVVVGDRLYVSSADGQLYGFVIRQTTAK